MPTHPRMRPEFEIPLRTSGDAVLRRLNELLDSDEQGLTGQVLPGHAVVQMRPDRRSMLSPFLNLESAVTDRGPVLRGRFSPHPNVWTGFMATYLALGMSGLLSAIYGISQWWLGDPAWGLLGVPASLAAIGFVYGAAVIGQGLTAAEMYELRALVDRAVRESDVT